MPTNHVQLAGPPLTANYKPSVRGHLSLSSAWRGRHWAWHDIEDMRQDPRIQLGLRTLAAPITGVKWTVKGDDQRVVDFVDRQLTRVWQQDLAKLLRQFEYGAAGGEITYKLVGGLWEVDCLHDIHLFDLEPHGHGGQIEYLQVKNVAGSEGGVHLPPGRWWWVADDPEFGSVYGHSRLQTAWEPWKEKRGQKGATDIRRIWFFKNAFRGGTIRHPIGNIDLGEGVIRSCQDYAREILEKFETGGILVLPNVMDDKSNYLWVFEPPAVHGDVKQVLDYPKDLDAEICEALGIPVEVLKASETGSGWSGRSVPLLTFLTSLDRPVSASIRALDQQSFRPLVAVNFGPGHHYEIEPVSLVPKDEPQAEQGGQPPGGGGQPPPQPGPQQPPLPNPQPGKGRPGGAPGAPAPAPGQVRLSAGAHAPAGGVTIQGMHYQGGQFIPGSVIEKATPAEKAKVQGSKAGAHPPGHENHEEHLAEMDRLTHARAAAEQAKDYHGMRELSRQAQARGKQLYEAIDAPAITRQKPGSESFKPVNADRSLWIGSDTGVRRSAESVASMFHGIDPREPEFETRVQAIHDEARDELEALPEDFPALKEALRGQAADLTWRLGKPDGSFEHAEEGEVHFWRTPGGHALLDLGDRVTVWPKEKIERQTRRRRRAALSLEQDRSATESADSTVDAIIDRGAAAGIAVTEAIRAQVKKAVAQWWQKRKAVRMSQAAADGDGEDVEERAAAIAEILIGLYGDDALSMLEEIYGADVEEIEEGQGTQRLSLTIRLAWSAIDHPRDAKGRFIEKNSAAAVEAAHGHIKKALKGEASAESLKTVTEHLSILSVKQLHELKKKHGLKASGKTKEALQRKIAERLHGAKKTAASLELEGKAEGEPWKTGEVEHGKVYNAPTDELHADPSRFQFKLNVDPTHGVTDEFRQVKNWNPDFAGVVSVWHDPADGKSYVVNGHHRYEMAQRLGVDNMAVRYVKADSAKEARAIGALINIAEGRGTATDAAKFMRDMGVKPDELDKYGVSLKGKLAADAVGLTALNDRQFDRLARGVLDPVKALSVAKHLKDHGMQDQLFGLLDKREDEGKDLSPKIIEEMAREMAETPTTETTESTLWGDITSEDSLFVPRNEVKSHVRGELSREVSDFLAVASKRRAAQVGKAGNVLDPEQNKQIAQEADRVRNVYDTLVNRKGEISNAVNEAAAEYAKAKTKGARDAAKQRAVQAVRDAVFAEAGVGRGAVGGGEGASVGGGAAAAVAEPAPEETAVGGRGGAQSSGVSLSAEEVLSTIKQSPQFADKGMDWQRYADRFGVEGNFKTGAASVDDLAKMMQGGYLRSSGRISEETVKEKVQSGNLNQVVIAKEPGKQAVILDGTHSLEAARRRGDNHIKVVVSDKVSGLTVHPEPAAETAAVPGGGDIEPAGVTTPGEKAPHEMTKDEFDEAARKEWKTGRHGRNLKAFEKAVNKLGGNHKKQVAAALAAGRDVPPEVLADYPELARPAAPAAAEEPAAKAKEPHEMTRKEITARTIDRVIAAFEKEHPQEDWSKLKAQMHKEAHGPLNVQDIAYEQGIYNPTKGSAFQKEIDAATDDAERHSSHVAKALAAGRPVPPEVLADYPELARSAEEPAPATRQDVATADKAAEQGQGDNNRRVGKDGATYVRAPAGGAVSDVNGLHYKGGHWMPIHGLSAGQEKHKGTPQGTGGSPPKPNEQRRAQERSQRSPMSPEDIEAERQRREAEAKWDEVRGSELGQMINMGQRPHKVKSVTNLNKWKEFAAGVGEEGVQRLMTDIQPLVDEHIARTVQEHTSTSGQPVTPEDIEWYKGNIQRYADDDAGMFGSKGHLKEVPSSFLARHMVQHVIETADVHTLHKLHQVLGAARGGA